LKRTVFQQENGIIDGDSMNIPVKRVHAFATTSDGGNPAGVVLNAPVITAEQMMSVSQALAVSETAFVYPSAKADFKVLFFSPSVEVDLCGHATIATFFTMAQEGLFQKRKRLTVTQETKAGIFPVDIAFSDDGNVDKVMMTQKKSIYKNIQLDIQKISYALGIHDHDIDTSLPHQIVSTGLFTLPLCVQSFDILKTMKPDFSKVNSLCQKFGVGSFHVFTFDTIEPSSIYHARNFAPPYGIYEDPVTGTANGAVCSYLLKHNLVSTGHLICEQGDSMGRPGRVTVELTNNVVKVGGRATIVEEKTLTV